jgi:hypothetical protein
MSDQTTGERQAVTDSSYQRRDVLGALCATGALALAGCGGGSGDTEDDGGDSGGSDTTDPSGNGPGTDGPGSDGTNTPGDSGCGPSSIAYTTAEFTNEGDEGPGIRTNVPESASITRESTVKTLVFDWGEPDEITVQPYPYPDNTIQGDIDAGDYDDYTETTDQYDFAVEGTRSFQSDLYEENRSIAVPADQGYVRVDVRINIDTCESATERAYTELITSMEAVPAP